MSSASNSDNRTETPTTTTSTDDGNQYWDDNNDDNNTNNDYGHMKPLLIYVKQSYSFPGFSIMTPCASSESLSTIIDWNNETNIDDETPMKPLNACPVSHEILMLATLKQIVSNSRFQFDVKLVNPNKMLPRELRIRMIHHLPVVMDPNNDYLCLDYRMDLIEYLQQKYPTKKFDSSLYDDDQPWTWKLIQIIHMVGKRFYNYVQQQQQQQQQSIKNQNYNNNLIRQQLIRSLASLNMLLSYNETQYLYTNNYPTILDCHLMPRLHHIRVLLQQWDHFQIPDGYWYLWHYLANAYKLIAFRRWCPSDQEIQIHWMLKMSNNNNQITSINSRSVRNKLLPLLRSKPTYTFDLPEYYDQITRL